MKNKLPPKKACRKSSGRDDDDGGIVAVSPPPTTSQPQYQQQHQTSASALQHQQEISSLIAAMSESRSSSPIALTNKQPVVFHHGENFVPSDVDQGEAALNWATSHAAAAADALVNLSNQHASRHQGGSGMATSAAAAALHQLPPACGAKQLSKLKRFLTTLVQFGRDLAPEICDRVRLLILALVNNLINVEEFHSKLQDLTGYPLRPFVIPFLKANLPLLQRELAHCARLARQTPQQFLLSNESLVYAPFTPGSAPTAMSPQHPATGNGKTHQASPTPAESGDLIGDFDIVSPFVHQSGNQQASRTARSPDNGSVASSRSSPPNKRVRSRSPIGGANNSGPTPRSSQHAHTPNMKSSGGHPNNNQLAWIQHQHQQQQQHQAANASSVPLPPPLTSVAVAANAAAAAASLFGEGGISANDELWRLLDQQMLALADAATTARRSALALRERGRDELLGVMARARISGVAGASQEVDDIRRRAEEAVNEIKRQACIELQRGVAAAEQKAREMVAAERARMMRELAEARQRGFDEATSSWTKQEESPEHCGNCGRGASERCSACEQVRYCGRFCQIHDWQRHRLQCRALTGAGGGEQVASRRSSDEHVNVADDGNNSGEASNNNSLSDSPPPPASKTQQQQPEQSNSNSTSTGPLVVGLASGKKSEHRRSKHSAAVKPESISPVGHSPSVSSTSTSCTNQARPESRHSTSAPTSCH